MRSSTTRETRASTKADRPQTGLLTGGRRSPSPFFISGRLEMNSFFEIVLDNHARWVIGVPTRGGDRFPAARPGVARGIIPTECGVARQRRDCRSARQEDSLRRRHAYLPSWAARNFPTSMAIRMVMYSWPERPMSIATDRVSWETAVTSPKPTVVRVMNAK